MYEGYVAVGCGGAGGMTTVVNHAATSEYIANLGIDRVSTCNACAALADVASDEGPWTTPNGADGGVEAPWYDPDVPESALFGGVVVVEVSGALDSPLRRDYVEALRYGALLTRERTGVREVRVRAVLAAASCCANVYGMRWLIEALRGCTSFGGCSDCNGTVLQTLDCCPDLDDPVDCTPGVDPVEYDRDEFLAAHLRCLKGAAVIDGPRVLSEIGQGCGCGGCPVMEVEWVWVATDPWYYRQAVEVLTEGFPDPTDCEGVWCDGTGTSCNCNCVSDDDPCGDPACPVATPPVVTFDASCVCLPLALVRECHAVPSVGIPDWSEVLPIVTITTGDTPLRGVTFQWHENRLGLPCDELNDTCALCPGILISYIPANSTFVLDSTTRSATVNCDGVAQVASRQVTSMDGGPVGWPVLRCGDTDACVCVGLDALANDGNGGATFTVEYVVREF